MALDAFSRSSSSSSIRSREGQSQEVQKDEERDKRRKAVDVTCEFLNGAESKRFSIARNCKRLDEEMVGNIIAVTHAQTMEDLHTANVAGFLFVKDVVRINLGLFGKVRGDPS